MLAAYSGKFLSTAGGNWSLIQTLDGFIEGYRFGSILAYHPTGTQFSVGAYNTNSGTGMYEMIILMYVNFKNLQT